MSSKYFTIVNYNLSFRVFAVKKAREIVIPLP